jgi:sporulation protein YlmC with PRC-barrel domain
MSELSGYTVEKGDPDPRGWTVVGTAGRRVGRVADLLVDTDAMKVRQLLVDRSNMGEGGGDGSMIALDADEVDVNSDTHEVVARRYSEESFDRTGGARASAPGRYGTPAA